MEWVHGIGAWWKLKPTGWMRRTRVRERGGCNWGCSHGVRCSSGTGVAPGRFRSDGRDAHAAAITDVASGYIRVVRGERMNVYGGTLTG